MAHSTIRFSLHELPGAASQVLQDLQIGDTVCFVGDLGYGKTTFIRELLALLGSSDEVTSPTYVLQHEYQLNDGRVIEHWDLYRLTEPPEELMQRPAERTIRFIEWGDKFPEILSSCDIVITFKVPPENIECRDISWRRQ